jgi:hypothetical protein
VTRALAEPGTTVVVPARSAETARTAVSGIARVELDQMDLMDAVSIGEFAWSRRLCLLRHSGSAQTEALQ